MKLIITINSGSLQGQKFDLMEGNLSIGRSQKCDIRFDPLKEKIASSQHAFIKQQTDGFYINDDNSTNGTLLNGQKITNAKLSSGDSIQFGTNGIISTVYIEQQENTRNSFETPQFQQNNPSSSQVNSADFPMGQVGITLPAPNISVMQSVSTIGLNSVSIKPETEKSNLGFYIGIGIASIVVGFLIVLVAGIILMSIGFVPTLIASFVAFIPALFYIFPIKWLDRYDPEPFWLLAFAFAWGALVAVLISIVANTFVGISVSALIDPVAGNFAGAVLAAPFFEELTKGAGLFVVIIFFRKYFDGILDGIIFAGVIALGFATVENVLYYGRAFSDAGFNGLLAVFVLRGILSPFAHVTFTAMTGIGFGIARESHNPFIKYTIPFVGLLAAMFLHACWNGVAMIFGGGFFIFYLIIEIPFFLLFVCFSFWIMWRQNRIIREMLAIDVAQGVIPKEHFEKATSAFKSLGWIMKSLFNGKYWATSRYIKAIGKLGLSYWHIQRATAAQGETMSFQQNPILREEVIKWREQV